MTSNDVSTVKLVEIILKLISSVVVESYFFPTLEYVTQALLTLEIGSQVERSGLATENLIVDR